MWLSPYRDLKHDVLATICQTQIFLALLAATMLQADPDGARSPWVDSVLTGLALVPVALCAVLASPVGSYLVNGQKREKALRLLGKGLATAGGWLRGRCNKGTTGDKPAAAAAAVVAAAAASAAPPDPPRRLGSDEPYSHDLEA